MRRLLEISQREGGFASRAEERKLHHQIQVTEDELIALQDKVAEVVE